MEKKKNNKNEIRLEESYLMDILEDKQVTATIEKKLKDRHICLENGEYWKKKNYRDFFLTEPIYHESNPIFNNLTYDYYIDKIILPRKGIDKSRFLGDFDMGNHNETPERLQVKQLIQEIQNTVDLYLDPEKGKNGEDLYKSIYKKIFDTSDKGGLLKQFEEVSNINLSDFNDEYSKYKFIKLMYKFCKTNYYVKKINFPAMFKTVSFTNVGRISSDDKSNNSNNINNSNGKYVALLKNELLKEIPLKSYVYFTLYFQETLKKWVSFEKYAQDLLFDKKYIFLEQLADDFDHFVKENVAYEKCREQNKYEETLFEAIYIWVLQFEFCSFFGDRSNVSKHICENIHNYRGYYVTENKFIKPPIEDYIQYHKNEFIKGLVTVDFNEKEASSLLEKCPKYIKIFMLWMKNDNMIQAESEKELNKLVLSSFLLASLLAMRDAIIFNEKANCCYYRANKSGNMDIMSKICKSERSENYYFRILWLKKISNIQMIILHSESALKNKLRVEKAVNDIILYLLSFQNFTDFKAVNERLFTLAQRLFPNEYINN